MIEDVFPIEHGDFPVSHLSFFRAESIASIPRHSTYGVLTYTGPFTCCVPRFIQKPFRFHVSNLQLQVVFPVADTQRLVLDFTITKWTIGFMTPSTIYSLAKNANEVPLGVFPANLRDTKTSPFPEESLLKKLIGTFYAFRKRGDSN